MTSAPKPGAVHGVDARAAGAPQAPSVATLFLNFLTIGLTGFGGVLPMARRIVVEQRRWLSEDEFAELLSLCQFLPGGNIINLSIALGMHFRGARGALASITGLIAAPSFIVIGLGILYERFQNDPHIRHLFAGVAAAASGMLIATAVKMALPLRDKPVSILIAGLFFVAMAVLRTPLLPTMLVLAPLSILLVWKAGS